MKKLLLLAVALLGTVASKADTYTVSDVVMVSGSTGTISVGLTNAAAVRDFQVSVAIPAGFTFQSAALTGRAASNYTLANNSDVVGTSNATITFVGYSTGAGANSGTAYYIAAGSGEIMTITVQHDGSTGIWTDNAMAASAGAETNDAAALTNLANANFTLTAGLLGDVNRSTDVTAGDASAITTYVLGTTPATFYIAVADVNNSTDISAGDASAVITSVLGSSVKGEVFDIDVDELEYVDAD